MRVGGGCHDCMNEPLAWREEEGEGRGDEEAGGRVTVMIVS